MSLFLFTRSDTPKPTRQKTQRNLVYYVTGVLILVSIALIAVVKLAGFEDRHLGVVFALEWVAMAAFGVSWLTKSEIILKDTPA